METKSEYWAGVIMGHWLLKKKRGGFESIDVDEFKKVQEGVLMGLDFAFPDGDRPVNVDAECKID